MNRVPPESAPAPPDDAPAEDAGKQLEQYQEVYELHEQGLSLPDIARKTGYKPGEIHFILNLKN